MDKTFLLGIDVGTTGVKTVIFDKEGNIVSKGYREYPITTHKNGWVEQDPDVWWNSTIKSLKIAISKASIPTSNIACVGLSGQTNSPSFLDKNGKPLLH